MTGLYVIWRVYVGCMLRVGRLRPSSLGHTASSPRQSGAPIYTPLGVVDACPPDAPTLSVIRLHGGTVCLAYVMNERGTFLCIKEPFVFSLWAFCSLTLLVFWKLRGDSAFPVDCGRGLSERQLDSGHLLLPFVVLTVLPLSCHQICQLSHVALGFWGVVNEGFFASRLKRNPVFSSHSCWFCF